MASRINKSRFLARAPSAPEQGLELQGQSRNVVPRRDVTYPVCMLDVLTSPSSTLANVIDKRRTLIITTPTVNQLYTSRIVDDLLNNGFNVDSLVLACPESNKSLNLVERICESAKQFDLDRKGLLISISGGVCSDMVTMAASWIRRGIGHIRIPTTLIGQIDAGIGLKGAVNFHRKKNYLGCFFAPETVLVDRKFLKTLPKNQLSAGLAEMIKMGLIADESLFESIESTGQQMLSSGFQSETAAAAMWSSIEGMLNELESNFYEELSYERLVDFGHTFSPQLESASNFQLLHGEAVAIDMALSSAIACEMFAISPQQRDRILDVLGSLKLPIYSPHLDLAFCKTSLSDAAQHRGGNCNLVLPNAIGSGFFVSESAEMTDDHLRTAISIVKDYSSSKQAS